MSDYWFQQRYDDAAWAETHPAPTFGREDLAEEDKPTWDYWEALWKRRFQPPEEEEKQ